MTRVKRRDRSPGKEFWRKFEQEVERAVKDLGNADVRRDVRIPGVLSGRPRQIDVLATGEVAGRPMTVIFEAKCYTGVVQIGTIDELVGKALDVAAQAAVLYAPNGFSEGARARAAGTKNSPLHIGTAQLKVDWPDRQPQVREPKLGRELPDGVLRHENAFYDEAASLVLTGPSVPAVPAGTDDYGRFFRREAPLFVDR
ncbi:restriction endonuclease [Streptomyces hawaiiensis]|uniref:restriction endonuclease n=1 Tax=Streptomyces hawaiiensis TaxID=67305 RepID=UPI003654FA25